MRETDYRDKKGCLRGIESVQKYRRGFPTGEWVFFLIRYEKGGESIGCGVPVGKPYNSADEAQQALDERAKKFGWKEATNA